MKNKMLQISIGFCSFCVLSSAWAWTMPEEERCYSGIWQVPCEGQSTNPPYDPNLPAKAILLACPGFALSVSHIGFSTSAASEALITTIDGRKLTMDIKGCNLTLR